MKKCCALLLSCLLCLALVVPAFAADQSIYLNCRSTESFFGTEETTQDQAWLSISGSNLKKTGTFQLEGWGNEQGMTSYGILVYEATAPVTVTLQGGSEVGTPTQHEDEKGNTVWESNTCDARVDGLTYDEATGKYSVEKEHVVYFDGDVYYDSNSTKAPVQCGTIQSYYEGTSKVPEGERPIMYQGTTATLSQPGIYAVEVTNDSGAEDCCTRVYIRVGEAAPQAPAFTDVAADAYYAAPVAWAIEKGVTTGTSETTFSPNSTCTTAQILTFLWRANGSPAPTAESPFTDVAADVYYADAAAWAAEKGLVSGTTFGGDTPCTRSATVTYLWKLAGSPEAEKVDFTDVAADSDYAQAVAWAVAEEITTGTSETTFSPDSTCTRGQIVTFLYRDLAETK